MAFLNKTYNLDKNENYRELLLSLGVPDEHININAKSTYTLKKDGDQYIESIITPGDDSRVLKFKDGVEFDEEVAPGIVGKSKFIIEGSVITQSQKFDDGLSIIAKREFSGDKLVMVITSNKWDGTARRYFTAA